MEYMKIEGQFPKFSNCAVTLGKFDGSDLINFSLS